MSEAIQLWWDCYDSGRGDLFTQESNRHPAKMGVGLCFRIFEHGEKMGYWKKGDVILDPLAGIGTSLVCGAVMGYQCVGVELEDHFVKLLLDNLEFSRSKWHPLGSACIYQGDARNLSKILDIGPSAVLASPPYANAMSSDSPGDIDWTKQKDGRTKPRPHSQGNVPNSHSAVITSPPYGDQEPGYPIAAWIIRIAREQGMEKAVETYRREVIDPQPKHGRWSDENIRKHIEDTIARQEQGHYSAPALDGVVGSPPYPSEFRQQHPGTKGGQIALELERGGSFRGYDGIVASPPYGDSSVPSAVPSTIRKLARAGEIEKAIDLCLEMDTAQVSKGNRWATHTREQWHTRILQALEREEGNYGARAPSVKDNQHSEAQIGNLRDPTGDPIIRGLDAVLSSPPFENREAQKAIRKFRDPEGFAAEQERRYRSGEMKGHFASKEAILRGMEQQSIELSKDNIGKTQGETYLAAMLRVYQQMHAVLKPGGVVCLVTKNPVKNKEIRRLDLDTIRLMEAVGFVFLERQMAMLVRESGVQAGFGLNFETEDEAGNPRTVLIGAEKLIRTERKSFFKRLFERAHPHLRVDHEDVLWFRKTS